jgi:hypothetical protein
MTLTELHATLDRLGPDISAWPAALAEPALDLMAVSDAAKDLFAAATEASLRSDVGSEPRWEAGATPAP